jgi:rubrerythrin
MSSKINWSEFRRRWFGSEKAYDTVLGILRHRYVDEKEHADRFAQHAQKARYPQFRETLLGIASEELKHAGLIAKKIKELGGWPPAVLKTPPDEEKNSWHYLLEDLEEERTSG